MSTNPFSVQDLMLDNHLYSRSSELSPPTAKATVGYNWTSIFQCILILPLRDNFHMFLARMYGGWEKLVAP